MSRRKPPELPRTASVADPHELARLSPRERQVLSLAAAGGLDKQIAVEMGVTLNTLRTYWTRIRGKLGDVPRSALAALYAADEATASALNPIEGAGWHIDVDRRVLVYYGDRGLLPPGETGLDEVMDRYHPEDRVGMLDLLRALEERDMPPFAYAARIVTPHGIETASAYVEAVRDETGRTVRIVGRHVPLVNLALATSKEVAVGAYRRRLADGTVTVDAGFRAIFRLGSHEQSLLPTIYSRICPDYREGVRSQLDAMLAQGERSRLSTARLCFEGGDHLWISVQTRIEYDGERPVAIVATMLGYE